MLSILVTAIPWFGTYTGYEQLPGYLSKGGQAIRTVMPKKSRITRIKGKLISLYRGYGAAPQADVEALARFEQSLARGNLGHILYGEEFLRYAGGMSKKALNRTVFSIHQPPSQWTAESLAMLRHVRHSVILYSRDLDFFSRYLETPPTVILYGVNTDFFAPSEKPEPSKRILYNGVHLRNLPMLGSVVTALSVQYPKLEFDFLVPLAHRSRPEFIALKNLPNVTWHAGLSSEELRELYRKSWLLLLPMNDSGANTAIVEALACGLPVVTTDVGGVRDYGGGTLYPIVPNNDVTAMVDLVKQYLDQVGFRDGIAARSRTFAETQLDWREVSKHYVAFYDTIRE